MSDTRAGRLPHLDGPVTYELAGWGVRAWAFSIDLLPFFAIMLAASIGFSAGEDQGDDAEAVWNLVGYGAGLTVLLLGNAFAMARAGERNGQTLGKQAMGLRVVRESGEPITLAQAFWREGVGRILLIVLTFGFYPLIDCLWPLWDDDRQTLHDKIAETRVVRSQPVERGWWPGAEAAQPAAPAPAPLPAPAPAPAADRPVRGGWLPPSADR